MRKKGGKDMDVFEVGVMPEAEKMDRRVCVFQHTHAHLCDELPNICVLTYDFQNFWHYQLLLLAKMVVGIGEQPMWLERDNVCDYSCENIPGGLVGTGTCEKGGFMVECRPLITQRDPEDRMGGIAVHIRAEDKLWLKCCTGELTPLLCEFQDSPEGSAEMCCAQGSAQVQDGILHLTSMAFPLHIAIKANGTATMEKLLTTPEGLGEYGVIQGENELFLSLGFAKTWQEAKAIALQGTAKQMDESRDYYQSIADQWQLDTPDANLNDAFLHARLNVEYGWFKPYGWVEALHHWICMWHMEHTATEEWAGNAHRTRELLTAQLERLIDGDKVPQFSAIGTVRLDWGGDNHFFFRCVEHYLKMTNDLEFATYAQPFMKIILKQTLAEYDPMGSGIMGFGTQLGNQEDFEGIPGKGSSSGCEAAQMLRIMGFVENLLGHVAVAEECQAQSQWRIQTVYDRLWMRDVGRFAWYEDEFGQMRLEPAYHSICYPILYNMLNDQDKVSSVDHLLHRMTGPDGEMYISNHFGGHAYYGGPTWGMQCGANMQPFAAMTYAKLGMREEAIRPLSFIADIVCGPKQRGAFPETANEGLKGYFTPAACMYAQGIIEGVFGLSRDRTQNTLVVAPCFPKDWQHAGLRIGGIHIQYKLLSGLHSFKIHVESGEQKSFLWRLPPFSSIQALVNGHAVDVKTTPRCGWFEAEITLGIEQDYFLEIAWEEITLDIHAPKTACLGQVFDLSVSGAQLEGIQDKAGIFDCVRMEEGRIQLKVQEDLLAPYERFGWFGRINFARRTYFLQLRVGETRFTYPMHLVVVPPCAFRAAIVGTSIRAEVCCLPGQEPSAAMLVFAGSTQKAALKNHAFEFALTSQQMSTLSPGKNTAQLLASDKLYTVTFDAQVTANIQPIALPEHMLRPPEYFSEIGKNTPEGSTLYSSTPDDFLKDVFESYSQIEPIPGVEFVLNKKGFLPVSSQFERNVTVPLGGVRCRKVYVLLSAFINNQHTFSEVFRMEIEAVKQPQEYITPIWNVPLCFPGDLDIGLSGRGAYGFPTYVGPRESGYIPEFPNGEDYPSAMPPAYPQHVLWNQGNAFQICETVFSIIEIPLEGIRELKELRISVQDAVAGMGIYAISIDTGEAL